MNTLADIAAELGIDTTTARVRCEGLTLDHVGNNSPLSDADASLIRASVAR
jgi:hypothetical protein